LIGGFIIGYCGAWIHDAIKESQLRFLYRNLNDIDLYVIVTLHYYSCKQIGDMMVSFTNAAANGGLLLAGLFMALFLYVYVTDAL